MSILGSYLTLEVDGSTIAETTDVNMKIVAKALDTTSKESGLNTEVIGGGVKILIAGTYLMSSDGANWDTLWSSFKDRSKVTVGYFRNGVNFLLGHGILKKLTAKGGIADSLITGTYGITYTYEQSFPVEDNAILTELGIEITAETGETLLVE